LESVGAPLSEVGVNRRRNGKTSTVWAAYSKEDDAARKSIIPYHWGVGEKLEPKKR